MLILDLQGFQHTNEKFIVKELAVQAIGKNECACLLFQPPYRWDELPKKYRRTNNWIINNHHGIEWGTGFIPYDEVENVISRITQGVTVIFVNGFQKKRWLESYTNKIIIDLNELGCSKAQDLSTPRCWNHHEYSVIGNYTCAFENCGELLKWYRKYFTSTLDSSNNFVDWVKDMNMLPSDPIYFLQRFLLKFAWQHVDELWETLSERLKNISEIQDYRRCYDHHPTSTNGGDVIDGPVPLVKDYHVCDLSDWIIFCDDE